MTGNNVIVSSFSEENIKKTEDLFLRLGLTMWAMKVIKVFTGGFEEYLFIGISTFLNIC